MRKGEITVAVDGPAGSGKSSVSKQVAGDLGLKYIDSGALYRSITWYALECGEDLTEGFDFSHLSKGLQLGQEFISTSEIRTEVNGKDVSREIRDERIARYIGVISDNTDVRNFVNSHLRSWAEADSVIMDGRDIGSVVFPNADLKIYLDASVEIRTERRLKEYQEMGKNVDENMLKNQIILRDEQDRGRAYGALVQAEDAVYIDTSLMSFESVIAEMEKLITVRMK